MSDNDRVPAGPIRDHIRTQMAAGLGWMRLAELAGVHDGTVSRLLYRKHGRDLARHIQADTAQRLLAVTANPATLALTTNVDATGTIRRIQGLAHLGYSLGRISAAISHAESRSIARRLVTSNRVTHATATAVRELAERWRHTPPIATTRRNRISVAKAQETARKLGWSPLWAWDGLDIDDPAVLSRGPRADWRSVPVDLRTYAAARTGQRVVA